MRQERIATTAAQEFLPRGEEHGRFLGGMPSSQARTAPAVDRQPASSARSSSTHTNAFASSAPVCDARD